MVKNMNEQNTPDPFAPTLLDRVMLAADALGLVAAVLMLSFWGGGENFRYLLAALLVFGEGIFECTCRKTVWGWEQPDPLAKPEGRFFRKRRIIVALGILLGSIALGLTLAKQFNVIT